MGLGNRRGPCQSPRCQKMIVESFVSESYNGADAHLLWTGIATSLRQEGRQRIRQAVKRKGASLLFGITKAKTVSLWTGCLEGRGKKNQKPRWNVWQECVPINDLLDREEAPLALLIRVRVGSTPKRRTDSLLLSQSPCLNHMGAWRCDFQHGAGNGFNS